MGHFIGGQFVGMIIGWVVGCFTPGIYRGVKGWLTKEEHAVKSKL